MDAIEPRVVALLRVPLAVRGLDDVVRGLEQMYGEGLVLLPFDSSDEYAQVARR